MANYDYYSDARFTDLIEYIKDGKWTLTSPIEWRGKILTLHGTPMSDRQLRTHVANIKNLSAVKSNQGVGDNHPPFTKKQVLTSDETPDSKTLTADTETRITTIDEAIKFFAIDPDVWYVDRCVCNKWEMGYKDEDGEGQAKELYQVKLWLKRHKAVIAAIRADFKGMCEESQLWIPPVYGAARGHRLRNTGEHALEVDCPDIHLGKLALGEETGDSNYDVNIAEYLFFDAVERSISATSGYDISEICFPVGNDLLNCDNSAGTTTLGTPQSVDGRHKKTYKRTRLMIMGAIERLREIAPVKVIGVVGNHDSDSSWYLMDAIEGWMQTAKDVTFDNRQYPRKTYAFGANAIMFTHGEEKRKDLALTFASEFPDVWAAATYREVHCGHLHTTITEDYRGAMVRFLPSLSANDYWHSKNNYKSRRAAKAFVWSRRGETAAEFTFNAPLDKVLS